MKVKRGDIFWINFSKREGSRVIYGTRPVIIVSNDIANHFSPVVSVVPVTQQNKKPLPSHVRIAGYGLATISTALTEQVQTVDKIQLLDKIGSLANTDKLQEIDQCLRLQLGVA